MTSLWKLTYDKFDPEQENLREALCTLGNGYLGTRGAAPETGPSRVHYPGTYIAGVYNTLVTPISGQDIANEDFVNCPNWTMINYRIDRGPWFDRLRVKILKWKKELDLKNGVLHRRLRWEDDQGRITSVNNVRIVSMAHPHCAAIRCVITPENYDGDITVRCGIDGQIINAGVERYRQLKSKHLEPCSLGAFGKDGVFLQMQTNQSRIQISQAQRTLLFSSGKRMNPKVKIVHHGRERIIQEFRIKAKKGQSYTIEKLVSIYTSRDQGVSDNCVMAQEGVKTIRNYEHLYKSHQAKWDALWKRFDIEIEGDQFVQKVLRLHTFHLLQTASTYNEDIDTGMPARGLHGEAYRGHVFWDELYAFSFYNLHAPEITRALLMYRYRRLQAAKESAKSHGFKGAMYPWQSASTGEETTQVIHLNPMSGTWGPDYSSLQRHVSLAVAHNVWTYYYTTGDRDFLDRYGAEMMLEIARFWSSVTQLNSKTGRYEIEGVMGPDEFHEKYPGANKGGLKNNAYTNVLVVWLINKALQVLETMRKEDRTALLLKVAVDEKELERWRDISKKMTVPMSESGLIYQFEGYQDLQELEWEEYRTKYENIHRIDRILKSEGLSPDSYKVSKQADVVMLFYVLNFSELQTVFKQLGYRFDKNIMRKNYDYYMKRTSHGSTLSKVVYAFVAERLGHDEVFMKFFIEALESDIYDTQGGTTREGIHCGVMGGTVDLFLRGFAGLTLREDRICFNPDISQQISRHWKKIKFHVRYKNIWFSVRMTQKDISVLAEPLQEMFLQTGEVLIEINKKIFHLKPGKVLKVQY
jgi:alpha,alpha-trehalase